MKWSTFDFETSNSKRNIEENYTRVWLWDIYNPEEKFHKTGNDIESFFDYLFTLKSRIFYAHNLKFDGSFMLAYLLKYGFEVNNTKQNYTISTLITDRLTWYSLTIYFEGSKYVFRDSSKKIIGSLEKAGKDFGLKEEKGSIDYNLHRDIGYEPTQFEIEYVQNDTKMLANILQYYYDNGMTGITNASDALKEFKNIISVTGFKRFFPVLDREIDDFIRRSYKGGFCYLNKKHFNKVITNVYTYDVKSMYPWAMTFKELPYGIPFHYNGKYEKDEIMPLYIQEINVDCKLKKGHTPTIQTKSFLSIRLNYLKDTEGKLINLNLTNIDLKHLFNDYEIFDIEYVQGYKFSSSDKLFKEYIEKYYTLKETSKGAVKQLYKIFLNSLYGKFAMMMERRQAIPHYINDIVKYAKSDKEEVDPIYTAVASFITSYSREKLINEINNNKNNFIYCDTDSVHLTKPLKGLKTGKQLGDWDIENGEIIKDENGKVITHLTKITKAKYLGQKCYILCTENNEIKKIAGAPNKVKEQINLENFNINFISDADLYPKFRMKNVKGGVLLIPTTFSIKSKIDR